MHGRFRWWLIGAGILAVAAGVVVAVFAVRGSHPAPAVQNSPQAQAHAAHDVATALGKLASDPQSLVAASSTGQVGTQARAAVPAGSTVVPVEKSWRPDGIGGGVMTVVLTPPGGPPTTYLAIMVHEPTGWKVEQTLAVPPSGTPSAAASPS